MPTSGSVWRAPDGAETPPLVVVESQAKQSRWHAGATTFGPATKIAITVFLLLGTVSISMLVPAITLPLFGVPLALFDYVVLKALWAKEGVDTARYPVREAIREMKADFRATVTPEAGPPQAGRAGGSLALSPPDPTASQATHRCRKCHAMLAPSGARWCPACKEPTTDAEFVLSDAALDRHVVQMALLRSEPPRETRWERTPTTFGPIGRIAASGAVILAVAAGALLTSGALWTMWMVPPWARVQEASEATTTARTAWFLLLLVPYAALALLVIWRKGVIPPTPDPSSPPWRPPAGVLGPGVKFAVTCLLIVAPIYFLPGTLSVFALVPSLFILIGVWTSPTRE